MADGTPRTGIVAEQAADRLYIIDARNRVERRILLDWIHATVGDVGGEQAPQWTSLAIADGDHALDLAALQARLADAHARQAMPLRVARGIPGFDRARRLKFRHLLFGEPARPAET